MKLLLSGNSGQIAQAGNFNGISTRLEEQLKILNPKCTNLDVSVFSPLLLGHWYEIMALYYVKSILTEISASRQDRRVLQKGKIIRIEFLSKWGMLQTSRYV